MIQNKTSFELGKSGEEAAIRYLKNNKFRIIERNFHFFRGEIDIIAYDRKTLVFLEVKTRRSKDFGPPEESVTVSKQRQIKRIAQAFLAKNNLHHVLCRFDVISLSYHKNEEYSIKHIKDAF